VRAPSPHELARGVRCTLADTMTGHGGMVVLTSTGMDEKEDVVAFLLVAVIETIGVSLISYLHGRHLHALVKTEKGAEVMTSMSSLLSSVQRL